MTEFSIRVEWSKGSGANRIAIVAARTIILMMSRRFFIAPFTDRCIQYGQS